MDHYIFAKRLLLLREKRGYAQLTVSQELNVPLSDIIDWERGEKAPDREYVFLLAKLYDIPYEDLTDVTKDLLPEQKQRRPLLSERIKLRLEEHKDAVLFPRTYLFLTKFPFPIIIVLIMVYVGLSTHRWSPIFYIVFTIPVYYFFTASFATYTVKDFLITFPFPIIVLFLFAVTGYLIENWTIAWLIWLSVPLYYYITYRHFGNAENPDQKE